MSRESDPYHDRDGGSINESIHSDKRNGNPELPLMQAAETITFHPPSYYLIRQIAPTSYPVFQIHPRFGGRSYVHIGVSISTMVNNKYYVSDSDEGEAKIKEQTDGRPGGRRTKVDDAWAIYYFRSEYRDTLFIITTPLLLAAVTYCSQIGAVRADNRSRPCRIIHWPICKRRHPRTVVGR